MTINPSVLWVIECIQKLAKDEGSHHLGHSTTERRCDAQPIEVEILKKKKILILQCLCASFSPFLREIGRAEHSCFVTVNEDHFLRSFEIFTTSSSMAGWGWGR